MIVRMADLLGWAYHLLVCGPLLHFQTATLELRHLARPRSDCTFSRFLKPSVLIVAGLRGVSTPLRFAKRERRVACLEEEESLDEPKIRVDGKLLRLFAFPKSL